MADWTLEQDNYWDDCDPYGGLYDGPPIQTPKRQKTLYCNRCNQGPFVWGSLNGRWLLYDLQGNIHDCPKRPLSLDVLKELAGKKTMDTEKLPFVYNASTGKAELPQPLRIPSWDEQFMHDVYWWARRSKDPRTKIGAVMVKPGSRIPFSFSYNSPARGVDDNEPTRWERPEKYEWVVHAEENAVLNCSREGHCSKGAIMYTQGVPCTRCADAVVQGGIIEVVVHKQWQEYEKQFNWNKWIDSAKRSEQKFTEAGIKIRIFDGLLGMQGVLDGKVIDI